jgi:two-component system OmpR family response regulator
MPDQILERVLVVDNDPGAQDMLSALLRRHGYQVEFASDAREMEAMLGRFTFEAIVLDVVLPGEDGLSVCRRLARPGGPGIIMTGAMGEVIDRIVGLELGADDFLAKPYNPRELLARLRAVRRRCQGPVPSPDGPDRLYQTIGWRLDLRRRELRSPDGAVADLTSSQFSLLSVFAERPGQVLTGEAVLTLSHGRDGSADHRSIAVQISDLRQKLRDGHGGREFISTAPHQGYVFCARVQILAPNQMFVVPQRLAETTRPRRTRQPMPDPSIRPKTEQRKSSE